MCGGVCMGILKCSNAVVYLGNKNSAYGVMSTSFLLAGALRCVPCTCQCASGDCCADSSDGGLLLDQEPG